MLHQKSIFRSAPLFSCLTGVALSLGSLRGIADEPPGLLPPVDVPAKAQSALLPEDQPAADKQAAVDKAVDKVLAEAALATARSEIEVISERYPNGAVRIRREVTQDEGENFVNHGGYEAYDQQGNLVMSGRYEMGKMVGVWSRTVAGAEINLGVDAVVDRQFRGPFVSSVEFVSGDMHGTWTIVDQANHKLIEWQFEAGKPKGIWLWYHSNGRKRKQVEYDDAIIKGVVTEWGVDGKIAAETQYVDGRRRTPKATYYQDGKQKKSEGVYLMARDNSLVTYDWGTTKVKVEVLGKAGPDVKDGLWTYWHPSGQVQMTGEYKEGISVGIFTWWYANGQKQAEGEYVDGQQQGPWTSWYSNGLKQSQGDFERGTPTGKWRTWNADGRVAEAQQFHAATEEVIVQEPVDKQEPGHLPGVSAPQTSKLPPNTSHRRTRTPGSMPKR